MHFGVMPFERIIRKSLDLHEPIARFGAGGNGQRE